MPANEALKTIAAFRLALPKTILRFAGGREITLGDLGTKDGLLGGINAVIVGTVTMCPYGSVLTENMPNANSHST